MQRMRYLLRGSLGRSLRELPPEDRLAAAWAVAAGPALAARAEVTGYHEGELTLHVRGKEWIETIAHMRPVLQSELSRIAGVPVTAIHLKQTR